MFSKTVSVAVLSGLLGSALAKPVAQRASFPSLENDIFADAEDLDINRSPFQDDSRFPGSDARVAPSPFGDDEDIFGGGQPETGNSLFDSAIAQGESDLPSGGAPLNPAGLENPFESWPAANQRGGADGSAFGFGNTEVEVLLADPQADISVSDALHADTQSYPGSKTGKKVKLSIPREQLAEPVVMEFPKGELVRMAKVTDGNSENTKCFLWSEKSGISDLFYQGSKELMDVELTKEMHCYALDTPGGQVVLRVEFMDGKVGLITPALASGQSTTQIRDIYPNGLAKPSFPNVRRVDMVSEPEVGTTCYARESSQHTSKKNLSIKMDKPLKPTRWNPYVRGYGNIDNIHCVSG